MEGQIPSRVAQVLCCGAHQPPWGFDAKKVRACTLRATHSEKETHVTPLPFRVSLRHDASQLSSRFASLGCEETVNAAWIVLQLGCFYAVALHFWITFLFGPRKGARLFLFFGFLTRLSCVTWGPLCELSIARLYRRILASATLRSILFAFLSLFQGYCAHHGQQLGVRG